MTVLLEVEDLRRTFGDLVAVDGVSLRIDAGETYGLLGPNGAGKTTAISMICGLLEPDAGTVTVCGESVTSRVVAPRRHIGYVPQDLALYPDLTARENLAFFGRVQGLSGRSLQDAVAGGLDVAGLADRADDRVEDYSGGMKRRLNIAIGLLHQPRLLILDEPTVGVDPQSRNAILSTVEGLADEGRAVLYTTHYMEEAQRLCDRVGIIDQGQLRAEGTRRELIGLIGEGDRVRLVGTGDLEVVAEALRGLAAVDSVVVGPDGVDVGMPDARHGVAGVLEVAASAGLAVQSVEVVEPDLETVFLHLTGKALRD